MNEVRVAPSRTRRHRFAVSRRDARHHPASAREDAGPGFTPQPVGGGGGAVRGGGDGGDRWWRGDDRGGDDQTRPLLLVLALLVFGASVMTARLVYPRATRGERARA